MLSRRKALPLIGTTVALGGVAGCLGVFKDGGIRIRIDNRDDQQQTVKITFEKGNETVFSDQYTVSPAEKITTSNVVQAGEYLVTVEQDTSDTKTVDFHMSGCNSNTLSVSINENGEFKPGVLDDC